MVIGFFKAPLHLKPLFLMMLIAYMALFRQDFLMGITAIVVIIGYYWVAVCIERYRNG